jgi:hypothetical protein
MAPPAVSTRFPLNVLKLVAGKLIAALSKIRVRFLRDKAVVALGVSAVTAVFLKLKSWKFAPPVITTFALAILFRMGFPLESVAKLMDVPDAVACKVKSPVPREVIEVPDCWLRFPPVTIVTAAVPAAVDRLPKTMAFWSRIEIALFPAVLRVTAPV